MSMLGKIVYFVHPQPVSGPTTTRIMKVTNPFFFNSRGEWCLSPTGHDFQYGKCVYCEYAAQRPKSTIQFRDPDLRLLD